MNDSFQKMYERYQKDIKVSKISNGNIMVKSRQKFPNRGGGSKKIKNFPSSKISQIREGGGSQNWGTVPKLYLVINYEGFPKQLAI